MRREQLALQLYTVRRLAANDLPGTLRAVAAAGYRSVEVAGIREAMLTEVPRQLGATGLRAIAAHVALERFRADADGVVEWLRALECPRVVVPSLPDAERTTIDGVRRLAAELSELARSLGERGLTVGYHNHASEFAALDGATTWQVLLDELAPEVELEIDVFWASVGGRDPATTISEAGSRVRLLHLKDRAAGEGPRDAPAGEGTLDFRAIVQAARVAGVEWYIVEQDEPGDALRDISSAYRYLATLAD